MDGGPVGRGIGSIPVADNEAPGLDSLLEKVYQQSGFDFRQYKRGTVTRRLQRRLYATGVSTYLEYMRFLEANPEECQRLADVLAIKVSSFFRSPYTFKQVAELVLPELVSPKANQGTVRIWSAACARGEEPYSIAMLLADFLGHRQSDFDISIYASDISPAALVAAQTGLYSAREIDSLPPDIVGKYFSRRGEGYVVSRDIRQMVNFSSFDLVSGKTPPFMKLDCIFCCNVLIYLQRQLQERVLGMLYQSLGSPGYLVLGEVETPTDGWRRRLECLDARAKIYKKVT